MAGDYGASTVVRTLRETLQAYLEAQYHIRDESLIQERRRLFEQPGVIHQLPYVEATPVYEPGITYSRLSIPDVAKRLLMDLAVLEDPSVGIYHTPYVHQSEALEAFLGRGEDIVIATGTGSGKTESFLMPILGTLAMEASERPESATMFGCRALLLYPMNALVNDQLARVRRMFGDTRVAECLKTGRDRFVRFGSYTSRTPYPGPRTGSRDRRLIEPMFEEFYIPYAQREELLEELRELGRWPSKDMLGFYAAKQAERAEYQSGQRAGQTYLKRNWEQRLRTQPGDRELFTRHEIQQQCPDLLITNYSMLEYMLMRPIERSIFDQTREWLHSHRDNQLIVVLDEAHMYRGAAGAEVALLLRRFHSRLDAPRERIRYILTSASLGESSDAEEATLQFARELSGLSRVSGRTVSLVRGVREQRKGAMNGTWDEATALAGFRLGDLQNFAVDPAPAVDAVRALARSLGWPAPADGPEYLRDYLFQHLTGFGPTEQLIREISGAAKELSDLTVALFQDAPNEKRERATEALLALCNLARRASDSRILLPARLHLFYRGVPALYACINRTCEVRLDRERGVGEHLLGRLYKDPLVHCGCSLRGRVFEVLTHRDCGAAFLRAYMHGEDGDFLWHEPSSEVGSESVEKFLQLELLVESAPHPQESDQAAKVWVDITTGRILRREPTESQGPQKFLVAYVPTGQSSVEEGVRIRGFSRCPVCTKKWRGRRKIMDLATKGEQPFANLIKAQIIAQPPRCAKGPQSPNAGRKSLLFSDGRQKAARLARDIPREVELDSFRQALALASKRMIEAGRDPALNRDLYIAFLGVVRDYYLRLFDGTSSENLRRHLDDLRHRYDDDWSLALEYGWDVRPPTGYSEALLRQLGSSHYSLSAATIGYVEPRRAKRIRSKLGDIVSELPAEIIDALVVTWILDLLGDFAFDINLSQSVRRAAAGYDPGGSSGRFRSAIRRWLKSGLNMSESQIEQFEAELQRLLTSSRDGVHFLDPNELRLKLALDLTWYQCQLCTVVSPVTISGHCPNCGSPDVAQLDPSTSEYIRARKGFWRNPVELALAGKRDPVHITAEEHTAQLSNRDSGDVYATTERYELQFQDVNIGEDSHSVDVLSSTTTMEVGVDIGSLVAVGLRNVPPQRENYQQRAGRAGRRGSAVSTVVTYAQGGPHDSYYFQNPQEIVAGEPRAPKVQVNNEKIARRHMNALLLQTFFHEVVRAGDATRTGMLQKALGSTVDFFCGEGDANFVHFEEWLDSRVLGEHGDLLPRIGGWLPDSLTGNTDEWIRATARTLVEALRVDRSKVGATGGSNSETSADDSEEFKAQFLEFLFDQGYLPSYAFPTDLCEFRVESMKRDLRGRKGVSVVARPQLSIRQALSEYAPGRLLVIDKRTYRSGGVTASFYEDERKRARPLFTEKHLYVYCGVCSYVQDTSSEPPIPKLCPVCGLAEIRTQEFIEPEVFTPEEGKSVDEHDRDQEFTYATAAQFPVPVGRAETSSWRSLGQHCQYTHARDRRLVIVNMGNRHTAEGFEVCVECGFAVPVGETTVSTIGHTIPYLVRGARQCNGHMRRVFLGTEFRSDLLVVRLTFDEPVATNMGASWVRGAIEDGLRTVSEALLLRASRYLEIDAAEFNVGFRIVPLTDSRKLAADVFLYDTLSGGAGYADQAGEAIGVILRETLGDLEACLCSRSCHDCLRHYQNRFWHERLDRHLAAAILRYVIDGEVPSTADLTMQEEELLPLRRMLELDGYACQQGQTKRGVRVPLLINDGNVLLAVGTYSALLDDQSLLFEHPLQNALDQQDEIRVRLVDSYRVSRNLPGTYALVKEALPSAPR